MTVEKMEKAKLLNQDIKYVKEQLVRLEATQKESSVRINGNNNSFALPLDAKEVIFTIAKASYTSKLEKLEKEFEEL